MMKTLSLETLLADLEKTGGIEKTASANKPNVSAELSGILEKKASEDITASAFAAGEALAKEFLIKLAAENEIQKADDSIVNFDNKKVLPNETGGSINAPLEATVENAVALGATSDDLVDAKHIKEAQIKLENKEMANKIMQKIAQIVGEPVTTPAAPAALGTAAAPNLIQQSDAFMTAQADKIPLPLPGADGSLSNILEAVVQRAKDQGAASFDLVNGDRPATGTETNPNGTSASIAQEADEISVPGVGSKNDIEKASAVSALVEAGCDFDSAVSLVKQAEEDLAEEADQQEKIAAVTALCGSGHTFDEAVELVKKAEAELKGQSPELEKAAAVNDLMGKGSSFEEAVELVKQAAEDAGKLAGKKAPKGKAAGAAFAKARGQEKKAAFDALIEAGVDFDQAAEMVKQAEIDVYGDE